MLRLQENIFGKILTGEFGVRLGLQFYGRLRADLVGCDRHDLSVASSVGPACGASGSGWGAGSGIRHSGIRTRYREN